MSIKLVSVNRKCKLASWVIRPIFVNRNCVIVGSVKRPIGRPPAETQTRPIACRVDKKAYDEEPDKRGFLAEVQAFAQKRLAQRSKASALREPVQRLRSAALESK